MINTPKKNPVTDHDYSGGGYFAESLMNVRNLEKWKQLKESFRHPLLQLFHIPENIDGVSFWKINRKLNRLAVRGIPKEAFINRKIFIPLPEKQSLEWASPQQKELIEKTIDELEGFENLRLSQFYNYRPSYIEKKTHIHISRWIEIEITDL